MELRTLCILNVLDSAHVHSMLELGREHMRTVAEYMAKAVEFDELARTAQQQGLKKRYTDLAECYRLLAKEREQLVTEGAIPANPLPSLPPP